jgi:hypothetical protein
MNRMQVNNGFLQAEQIVCIEIKANVYILCNITAPVCDSCETAYDYKINFTGVKSFK